MELIAQTLRKHQRHGAFNCLCGERIAADGQESYPTLPEHQAAEVAKELELTQVYAPVVVSDDGYMWPYFNEWYDDRRQAEKAVTSEIGTQLGGAFVTPWTLA